MHDCNIELELEVIDAIDLELEDGCVIIQEVIQDGENCNWEIIDW